MRKALELMLWALMGAVVTFVLFSKPTMRSPLHQCQSTNALRWPHAFASACSDSKPLCHRTRTDAVVPQTGLSPPTHCHCHHAD